MTVTVAELKTDTLPRLFAGDASPSPFKNGPLRGAFLCPKKDVLAAKIVDPRSLFS